MKDHRGSAAAAQWPPTEEQLATWLGGFTTAQCLPAVRTVVPARAGPRPGWQDEGFRLCMEIALFLVAVGTVLWLGVVAWLLRVGDATLGVAGCVALAIVLHGAWCRIQPHWARYVSLPERPQLAPPPPPPVAVPDQPVVVDADTTGLRVRSTYGDSDERWLDLVGIEDHGSAHVLRFDLGEAMRLPHDAALAPVLRTAAAVVASRQAYDEAMRARMVRGLSRAEAPLPSTLGLSRVGGGGE